MFLNGDYYWFLAEFTRWSKPGMAGTTITISIITTHTSKVERNRAARRLS
jgi:hypothetical protein